MQDRTSEQGYHWPMPGGRPPSKPAPFFGQRMAAFRIAKGLSQGELADKLGMTRDLVTYYERAAKNPSLETVKKIADFFGVTVGEMLNDTARGAKKPGPPSKIHQLTERIAKLPPTEQKLMVKMIEGALANVA
jgi:transcriptional regulator with XRE-family HTH domain